MKVFSFLLYPFSLLYGLIVLLRNKLYDWGVFKVSSFDIPVISVGNLNMGGVGKTPHVEYLIRLLEKEFSVGILSRGYKRLTKGYLLSDDSSTIFEIGDEPLQYKRKFPNIPIAVDEKRTRGIQLIQEEFQVNPIVILDDAFQHRSVKPGINILVTDFSKLYISDYVVPTGNLREFKSGSDRADIIIVSKTPEILSPIERRRIRGLLKPKDYQQIYFSFLKYGELAPFTSACCKDHIHAYQEKTADILLLTGIANPYNLSVRVKNHSNEMIHLKYPDHHPFNERDIVEIRDNFDKLFKKNKLVITTEKDIMRLSLPDIKKELEHIPIYYIPIEVVFHEKDDEEFNHKILNYVRTNS